MRKTLLVLIAAVLLFGIRAAAQHDPVMAQEILPDAIVMEKDYTIVVNGTIIESDVPPVEVNGVIFVPIRFISEAMGANVTWVGDEQRVILAWNNSTTEFVVNDPEIVFHGDPMHMEEPPFLFNGRVYLPLKISAQSIGYYVTERPNVTVLTRTDPGDVELLGGGQMAEKGNRPKGLAALDGIKKKAKQDEITKLLKPYVLIAWAIAICLWILRMMGARRSDEQDRYKPLIIIALTLGVLVPAIYFVMLSTFWAMMVAIGTCIVGLVSYEDYEDKLVTMASTAQGLGLICTLFGLGLLIGPAIADRDIHAIGYGIYVKIEPTITGLFISIILSMMVGYEARRR